MMAKIFSGYLLGLLAYAAVPLAYAQEQVLSVTPPLFQLSALPGDIWQSSIKVVNGNAYPLTVYAEVVNFQAQGETGRGRFIPVMNNDEKEKLTLAEWIEITKGPYTISPEQTKDIPFIVEVPKDAPPGGHYAAVLISTEPPADSEGNAVLTSQAVTSLFFVRIEGDVKEVGTIREFRVTDGLLSVPSAEFSLRFENKGNVHLQPRGNIIITNMWGTERGVIPINHQTHFGNVLPASIRDFKFIWKSDFSITDIGRYTAEVALVYGEDGVKSEMAKTHFWVIPVKGTLITLTVLFIFIGLIALMVKAYVRRMLALAGVDVDRERGAIEPPAQREAVKDALYQRKSTYRAVSAPLRSGVLDLRKRLSNAEESEGVFRTVLRFVVSYKTFFVSVVLLIGIFASAVIYIQRATEQRQNYEVIIDEGDSATTIRGEEIHSEFTE